ncbi:MAG TPA: TonB-dependent receptor, partial [Phaeodactylibacter sp.]|nr:TonB-dependent receptor [Phaeodactylibacter sp.]
AIELQEATVTATRALVEVKADRTVFNVQGTINAVGEDAISLLRKAPGVMVDNNNNISVLGRSGVLVYIDGKRLPISGDELSGYLQSLTAEQIDRIDIITNPGAKYEAEGNAGIIDIRLKKDKNLGTNGSVSGTFNQGEYKTYNGSAAANYRNKKMNVFASLGGGGGKRLMNLNFISDQNAVHLNETNKLVSDQQNINYRFGTDFFISKNSTIGFLINGNNNKEDDTNTARIELSHINSPMNIDSILLANNLSNNNNFNQTYNINYQYSNRKGRSINIDLDYGNFLATSLREQPNRYYDAHEENVLSESVAEFDTKRDIDIYTAKIDFQEALLGGQFGLGAKYSRVNSDNDFLVYDVLHGEAIQNLGNSNLFAYDEKVAAAYISFARDINKQWKFSAGLRAEQTAADGTLTAFVDSLQEEPVVLKYLDWFPSLGFTYQPARIHTFSLNYGRRINRPNYQVLNPFENRLSELSYSKGNPRLNPEIVNNIELGYTFAYRYNVKLAYSKTSDQITRLIAPDEDDPRAGFITWDNLAEQTIYSLNLSLPFQITKFWSAYFNLTGAYQDNQGVYDNGIVDLQTYTYNIYQQQTFTLPKGFRAEVSGYYSGPGIWGGVFRYDPSWDLGIGLQKKFLQERLNVKVKMSDIFYQAGWSGSSEFAGLSSTGMG